jgi:Flp pilus assembly protein TadD
MVQPSMGSPGIAGSDAATPPSPAEPRRALLHEQLLKLALIVAAAIVGFFLTRAVSANNRAMSVQDAADWYTRGRRELQAGDVAAAIQSLRRAATISRTERRYVLALAEAFARNGDYDRARSELLRLRDETPDNPDINLRLARLSAMSGDSEDAIRSYHTALYAPWPAEQSDLRRAVRYELVRFLLAHRDQTRADAELVALSADVPSTADAHVKVAQLFADAGDMRRAADQYLTALRLAPQNRDAVAGAGLALFLSGDYAVARRYLNRALNNQPSPEVRHAAAVAEAVVRSDPLSGGIGAGRQLERLKGDLAYVQSRLQRCLPTKGTGAPDAPAGNEDTLQAEIAAFERVLERAGTSGADVLEQGADLIDRGARKIAALCSPLTPQDEALVIVARRHAGDSR